MKIAVDAMGGDNAPEEIIKGVELARNQYSDINFRLFGSKNKIKSLIKDQNRIEIVDSPEIINMGDSPVKSVMRKKHSSLVMAAKDVKKEQSDAFLSAGNSGAILAAGLFIIGRIKGIDRPGFTTTLPIIKKENGSKFVMLDVGANAESKPFNLYQYAFMGKYYAQKVMKLNNPRIGLLNNGTEADKGDSLHQNVYNLLSQDNDLNFIGNVESRELLNGAADVVITDGFTGNATLKSIEGTALTMLNLIKNSIMNGGISSKLGALMLKSTFKSIGDELDYSKYGGAALIGVNAPVIKMHGSSKANTIKNTINQIRIMVSSKTNSQIINYFKNNADKMNNIKKKAQNNK